MHRESRTGVRIRRGGLHRGAVGLALALPLTLALASALAPTARADIGPPEGQRVQMHDVKVDLGPYGDVLPTIHRIEAGDTLGALAQRYLGSTKRWTEIRDANPGLDPAKLPVDRKLVIPPRVAPLDPSKPETADGPKHRWDFHTFTGIWNAVDDLPPNRTFSSRYHMGTWLIAVRHDKRAEFEKLGRKEGWLRSMFDFFDAQRRREAGETVERPDWLAVGQGAHASKTWVKDDDPVVYALRTVRVTAIRDGVIQTEELSYEKFGAGGKVLSESEIVAARNKGAMVFIFLGLLGLVALVHVTVRRRRAERAAAIPHAATTAGALVLALLLGNTPASADIPVPGQRNIQTTVHLVFGPYAEVSTRVAHVQEGETLAALAERLGMRERMKEVLGLNPTVDPETVPAGTTVLLPPVKRVEPDGWWDLLSIPGPSMRLMPFGHGQEVPVLHYGTTVVAVRHDKLAEFQRRYAEPQTGRWALLKTLHENPPAWFASTTRIPAGRGSVKTSSPVHRVTKRMRITSIANGVLGVETLQTTYHGKDGRILTEAEVDAASRRGLLLLVLAGLGLVGLGVVLVRRRVVTPAAA